MLCIKLVNYWDKYTEMHGQQNVQITNVALPNGYKKDKNERKRFLNVLIYLNFPLT